MKLISMAVCILLFSAAVFGPLLLAQDVGYVKTNVNPGRAGVFIDGKYVGPAANFRIARKYPVAAGEHELKLVDARYEEYVTKIQVEPGKTVTLAQTLKPVPLAKPPFGTLRVKHPDKFAAVYINEYFYGHVDEYSNFAQGLLLNPGEYELRVEPVSVGQAISRKVTIEADKVTVVRD